MMVSVGFFSDEVGNVLPSIERWQPVPAQTRISLGLAGEFSQYSTASANVATWLQLVPPSVERCSPVPAPARTMRLSQVYQGILLSSRLHAPLSLLVLET